MTLVPFLSVKDLINQFLKSDILAYCLNADRDLQIADSVMWFVHSEVQLFDSQM